VKVIVVNASCHCVLLISESIHTITSLHMLGETLLFQQIVQFNTLT